MTDSTRVSRPELKITQLSARGSKSFKKINTSCSILNLDRNV